MILRALRGMAASMLPVRMWRDPGDDSDDVIHVVHWRPFFLESGIDLFSWRRPM